MSCEIEEWKFNSEIGYDLKMEFSYLIEYLKTIRS